MFQYKIKTFFKKYIAITWMDLEIITLREVRERQISYDITYTWNDTKNDTNELIYKTEIDSQT